MTIHTYFRLGLLKNRTQVSVEVKSPWPHHHPLFNYVSAAATPHHTVSILDQKC